MTNNNLTVAEAIIFVNKLRMECKLRKLSDKSATERYCLDDCNMEADLRDAVYADADEQGEYNREAADFERETMQGYEFPDLYDWQKQY